MRPPAPAPHLLVLADDLSGAAETCGALLPTTDRVRLLLAGRGPARPDRDPRDGDVSDTAHHVTAPHDVVVVDLDCRHAPAAAARSAAAGALAAQPSRRTVVKVDSLLRGSPGAVLAAVLAHPGTAGAVVAPALPAAGRTTGGGVVHLHGVPLHRTAAWAAEGGPAPTGIAAALAADGSDAATSLVPLDVVRSPALADHLARLVDAGLVAVCDAEDDDDLAAVARAAATLPGVALVGASALVAAVARELLTAPPTPAATTATARPRTTPPATGDDGGGGWGAGLPGHPVLVVVGTAETGAAAQVAALRAAGAPTVALDVDALLDGGAGTSADELAALLASGTAVVHLSAPTGVRPGAGRTLVAALVDVAATAVRRVEAAGPPVDLVLTGGETARRVLDALGVDDLHPRHQVHLGAVVCQAPDGRRVATRPGSFGGADSLLAIARALHRGTPRPPPGAPPRSPSRSPAPAPVGARSPAPATTTRGPR